MVKKIVLILLFLIIVSLVFAYIQFSRMVDKEVKTLYSESLTDEKIITEEMLQGLPSPVQRYLRYSGVIGKPWTNTVYLKQVGQMKTTPEGKWFPIVAEEYYSTNPPAFIWHVWGPKQWLPVIQGRDKYQNGEGELFIKLISIFPVANAKSEELDQGAMMRYLNEMMWFPTAFLGDNVTWKYIDENSAEVTLFASDKSVSAVIYFDNEGKLVNFVAQRYYSANSGFSLEKWETPISEYGQINGFNLPTKGSAVWKLNSGDCKYIDISVDEIIYNQK